MSAIEAGRWRFARYLGPAALLLIALSLFPILYSIRTSLYASSFAATTERFVGIGNFTRLLSDYRFLNSLWVTARIALPALALEMLLGTLLAVVLNRLRRGRGILVTILSMPVMIAGAAAGMAFRLLFTPQWGPIDSMTRWLTGSESSIDWLGSTTLAPLAVVIADVWHATPFVMLIVLAGMASIPDEIGDAAMVDGANRWQEFWQLTMPLVKRFLLVALVFRLIELLKIFDVIFVMTSGGPASATETVSFFGYRQGVQFFHIGYAAALGLVLTIAVLILTRFLVKAMR